LAAAGTAWTAWSGTRWAALQEWRGSLSAWLLVGVGAAFFVWGMVRARRNKTHSHLHMHANGTVHEHSHAHEDVHMHVHAAEEAGRSITPWVLFTIFIFGPCESLVPLMLAAWAAGGLAATVLVAGAFSVTTIVTIMGVVGVLLLGVNRIPLGKLDRYSLAAAGAALVVCGVAIKCGL
jgi:ABC-type nickel/cobalt efflux system permease component RcnA